MKKVWKYLVLIALLLQLPFVFRVCSSYQLAKFQRELPGPVLGERPFRDLRGTIHVHSAAGSHSMGTYRELIEAARTLHFGYLFITDHPREYQLFNQVQDPDVVMVYGTEQEREDGLRELVGPEGRVRIQLLYEDRPIDPEATGIEVFNIAVSARHHNNLLGWGTWLYHRLFHPELFFFHAWQLEEPNFELWDRMLATRKLSATAGNNAHQNVGLLLVTGTGQRVASLFLDPYVQSLGFVTNHLQLPRNGEADVEAVIKALAEGSSYIAFEQIADPTGFSFHAVFGESVFPMGSTVPLGCRLVFQSPYPVRFRLVRAGVEVVELEGLRFSYEAETPGAYRVEARFLNPPSLLDDRPWIISNPIYVSP